MKQSYIKKIFFLCLLFIGSQAFAEEFSTMDLNPQQPAGRVGKLLLRQFLQSKPTPAGTLFLSAEEQPPGTVPESQRIL
jgi:hypothetical protein